jgi:hypothetical protein
VETPHYRATHGANCQLTGPNRVCAPYGLRLVKGAQRVGLRLREIAELLEIVDRGQCACGHTEALLRQRLAEVDAELARLGALRGS